MPIFDEVRIQELESPAPFKIKITMDDEEQINPNDDIEEPDYTKSFLMELL